MKKIFRLLTYLIFEGLKTNVLTHWLLSEKQMKKRKAEKWYLMILFPVLVLQTLNSISAEKNSTIIFPLPIDLISSFLGNKND